MLFGSYKKGKDEDSSIIYIYRQNICLPIMFTNEEVLVPHALTMWKASTNAADYHNRTTKLFMLSGKRKTATKS